MSTRLILASSLAAAAMLTAACGSGSSSPGTSAPARPSGTGSSSSSSASASSPGGSAPAASPTPSVVGPSGGPVPAKFVPASTTFVSASIGWVLGTAPCATAPCTSILRTRDGGRSWQGIPAPKAALASSQSSTAPARSVRTVRFADQANGWVAGRSLYATHDGGASWKPVSFGAPNSEITALGTAAGRAYATAVTCSADNECAGSGTVYTAAVGSDTWTRLATVAKLNLFSAGLVVAASGWYLPASNGILHGTGMSAPATLPNPCPADAGYRSAPTVAVADAQHLDALCGGQGAAGSASFQLYGSTDGGQHWQANGAATRLPSNLTGMADNGHGVLLLATASGDSEVLRSADDGVTLPKVLTAQGGGTPWNDLGFTTADQAVVVLNNTALYLSRDAGRSWSAVSF